MGVQITDCTIRDGGYLLDKNPNENYIKGVLNGLSTSGIDFIETGFLQNNVNGESLVYSNSLDAIKYLPEKKDSVNFIGFCDNSRYSLSNLDTYCGKSFKWLRISFARHEVDASLNFCAGAIKKGFNVQFNPMDSISYTDAERTSLINKVNNVMPASFSIVDTFGVMDMTDLTHIFNQVDKLLNKRIKIGLHSHDNLGLSCALAERMIELANETNRDIIIDGSLYGMGRGAGNAKTELLANYVNKYCKGHYNINKLVSTINDYIIPITKNVHWGYNLPMFICGTKHSHVDNVYHLMNEYNCSINDIYDIIDSLPLEQRIRYGIGYAKNDFSALDNAYKKYIGD